MKTLTVHKHFCVDKASQKESQQAMDGASVRTTQMESAAGILCIALCIAAAVIADHAHVVGCDCVKFAFGAEPR